MSDFGTSLREARMESGRTMTWLASTAGISLCQWSDLERGRRPPAKRASVAKMVDALDVPWGELILHKAEAEYLRVAKAKWDR